MSTMWPLCAYPLRKYQNGRIALRLPRVKLVPPYPTERFFACRLFVLASSLSGAPGLSAGSVRNVSASNI